MSADEPFLLQKIPARTAWFERYPTGERYRLEALDKHFLLDTESVMAIYRNCAFGPAFDDIFYALFHLGYHPQNAEEFLQMSVEHWESCTAFSYALMSPANEFAGVIDLKRREPQVTEVGYWADPAHRGVMSNALHALMGLAREAGYMRLCLYISDDNPASLGVARRCNFEHFGTRVLERWGPEWRLEYFEKNLWE